MWIFETKSKEKLAKMMFVLLVLALVATCIATSSNVQVLTRSNITEVKDGRSWFIKLYVAPAALSDVIHTHTHIT